MTSTERESLPSPCKWCEKRTSKVGFRVKGSGSRVQGVGFRVWASGFRVQGLAFRVQGLGPNLSEANVPQTNWHNG